MDDAILGLDAFEEVKDSVISFIEIELIKANRLGNINAFLNTIGFDLYSGERYGTDVAKPDKILVIGETMIRQSELVGAINAIGLDVRKFDFILSYEDIKKFNFNILNGNEKYAHILVGPMGHNQKGVNGYSSMIARIESEEEDFPPVIRIVNYSNELCISLSSFKNALEKIYLEN